MWVKYSRSYFFRSGISTPHLIVLEDILASRRWSSSLKDMFDWQLFIKIIIFSDLKLDFTDQKVEKQKSPLTLKTLVFSHFQKKRKKLRIVRKIGV